MKIIIPQDSYFKMMQYVNAVDSEISGMADIEWDEKKENLVVGNVYLLKQTATEGTVQLSTDSLLDLMDEIVPKGATMTPRLWWHSHYTFNVFFSGTDEDTIKRESSKTKTFFAAVCINREGKLYGKVVVNEENTKKEYEDTPVEVTPALTNPMEPTIEIIDEVNKKVELVKEKSFVSDWVENIIDKFTEQPFARKRRVFLLPFNFDRAQLVVEDKNLQAMFDPFFHEWVFEADNGDIYRAQKGSRMEDFLNNELVD